jgi:hypothetical protein
MHASRRQTVWWIAACGPWLLGLLAPAVAAQERCERESLTGELFTGSAWSVPLPLTVITSGQRSRTIARYGTRPFEDAPYYSYRVGRQPTTGAGAELELVHHKLYLENPQPPVEHMEISHGYNLAMANVAGPGWGWQWRFGIGVVVAHPEGRVAGHDISGARTALGGGYHVAGITTQLAVGRRYALRPGRTQLLAIPEAKLTASWARVSTNSVTLTVPNVALHALGGLGVRHCS